MTGNLDAVVEQTDNSVFIQGENGSAAAVAVATTLDKWVAVGEIIASTPDLTLPDVPAGYILEPKALQKEDGTLGFTWSDSTKNSISYHRGPNPILPALHSFGAPSGSGVQEAQPVQSGSGTISALPLGPGTQEGVIEGEGSLGMSNGSSQTGVETTYEWEAGGYYHSLFTNDPTITQEDLKAMVP